MPESSAQSRRSLLGPGFALALLGLAALVVALTPADDLTSGEFGVLLALAVASTLTRPRDYEGTAEISGVFVCALLAVAFLGPVEAFVVVVAAEVAVWLTERAHYRPAMLPINLAAGAIPVLFAGIAFREMTGSNQLEDTTSDVAALAGVAIGVLVIGFLLLQVLSGLLDGDRLRDLLRFPREVAPALSLTVAITLAIAAIYAEYGETAGILVVLVLITFAYMTGLVIIARQRTESYASLSWGVLSALVRSLDHRDSRTARHSAAVARFARDIAQHTGMSLREAELAHTAGLLHDIGRFALPDRVMEREGTLVDSDWEAIQRHPTLGADMLGDLGIYGPVAEIVRAHHERIDGRGYPDGLRGDDIPQIARIVSVAEVYDTLTAEDTYRERMTSFQALTEMRRVVGKQLDGRYVEALAELLTGRGLDYRHADDADFDAELNIERRIAESVSPDPADGRQIPEPPPLDAAAGDEQS